MAPDRRDGTTFGARNPARLVFAVHRWKITIVLTGQNDGAGLDGTKRLVEVATIDRPVADVAVMPRPQHRQQIVGVVVDEGGFPEVLDEFLVAPSVHPAECLGAVEGLREAPPGVDRREG